MNTQDPLRACLERVFPWCLEWEEALRGLFAAYVEAKVARAVLDYDDLLLYWFHLMTDDGIAARIEPGRVEISASHGPDDRFLQLEIRDDGRGLNLNNDRDNNRDDDGRTRRGVGLTNIRSRLEQLYGAEHRFTFENQTGGGVIVRISLPYRRAETSEKPVP